MTDHFNKLTESETERLAMLAEEASEVIQIVGKILRHGYESCHPSTGENNRDLLNGELIDLISVHIAMQSNGDLPTVEKSEVTDTWEEKLYYTHHQGVKSYAPGS